jgi:hypothetical protein
LDRTSVHDVLGGGITRSALENVSMYTQMIRKANQGLPSTDGFRDASINDGFLEPLMKDGRRDESDSVIFETLRDGASNTQDTLRAPSYHL